MRCADVVGGVAHGSAGRHSLIISFPDISNGSDDNLSKTHRFFLP